VIELSRYVLEALRKDEEFVLYRGRAMDDASQVLLLSPVAEYPAPESLKRLENEYSLREELDSAWAVRPIAIARHWDRTVLTLEDPGGVPMDHLLSHLVDLGCSLRLAISLATAIGQLHQRGIIHKDIKPANILVNSASGAVWLTGFGIASRLPRERQSAEPPEMIAGTLAYMAPEQTGRMNRSIDSRSDLYSLGVTFYQMLTGVLPFTASDPMEWVHCHIARQPIRPDQYANEISTPLSAIVMKLLAKTAEERYQTAAGLEVDLRRCLREWESRRHIEPFPLGRRDLPDRLLIPEKLYGRDAECEVLLKAFDRVVTTGRPELMLVSGYSGVGKSSVVNELHKVLLPPWGLFASGKFDQYKRDIPYSTLAQAFQRLIRRLLGKSEVELAAWRDALRDALGPNGKLMVNLVPELQLITGEPPPVPELPLQAAQRRFQFVFRRFIGVFARPEHPLALFLDDLQWLDSATLDLLEDLLTQSDVRHLMLIGAYRDNEVNSSHPLMRKLDAIRKAGTSMQEIILAPLTGEDLAQLITDALHCEPERATALAELIHQKTAGNPFFAIQFISALVDEGLLTFDYDDGRWVWDLNSIHAKGYTDNVVELMVGKLNRLPVETQKALQEFACLGDHAEIAMLSIVHGTSEATVHSDLWAAVSLEFIVRSEGSYEFVHDRAREAAYALISEGGCAEAHLRIGRVLLASTASATEIAEKIFEIANQLNRGVSLITAPQERERVAELNLIAGKRAKISTAYASALEYLVTGCALLAEDCWERRYALTFALEFERAECEFLTADFRAAEERLSILSERATNLVASAAVTCLRAELYMTLDQRNRAVEVCLQYLRRIGVDWSPHPAKNQVEREYTRIWRQLGARAIEELVDLPLMTDSDCRATLDVLSVLATPAWYADENLHDLVGAHMANLSLEHGNSDGSCHAYALLGTILGSNLGQYQAGFRFGKLAVDLIEKRGLQRFKARVYNAFGHHIIPWARHLHDGRIWNRRAFNAAKESGDLTYAAFSSSNMIANLLAGGDPLEEVQREAEEGLKFSRKMRFELVSDYLIVALKLIRTLRGLTPKFGSFNDAEFDESRFEQRLEHPGLAPAACRYWIRKLQARFYAGDYASAVAAAAKAHLVHRRQSFFEVAEYSFYSALAHAALCRSESAAERGRYREAVATHYRQLEIWNENCPENFGSCAALVGAEIARIESRDLEAMHLYQQAIRSAHANGFIHHEAITYEVAARFYAARGFDRIADAYFLEARYRYLRWGALGKVRQLDERYPHLQGERAPASSTATIGTPVERLDLETVIKASQAVSGEIVLEKLIETLLEIAVEHAGAERGLLILPHGEEQRIEAEARTGRDKAEVHLGQKLVGPTEVPESLLRYVVRTGESVILDDASVQNQFSEDEYLRQRRSRSILCLPLVKQAKLMGVLYLENNLAPGVFTSSRIALLELLASQAAISLDNARLYSDLQRSEAYLAQGERIGQTGSWGWNVATGEAYWSQEHFRIFGFDPEKAMPSYSMFLQRIHPEDRRRAEQTIDRAVRERSDFVQEYRLVLPDGSLKYVHTVGRPFVNASGVFEFIGTAIDITDRVRAEEELRRSGASLREAQTELAHVSRVTTMGELAASIAHEVNQPLGAIANNVNACLRLLATGTENLQEVQGALSDIVKGVDRVNSIIVRMRALAKKAAPEMARLHLEDVVTDVLTLIHQELTRRHVAIQTELSKDLPPVLGDRVQLQQVLINLVMNGVEAMDKMADGERKISIRARRHEYHDKSAVLVSVQDSGVGLKTAELDRLFEAFYTTKAQGMGLGLAISRSIVEAHGGRLGVAPVGGPGTTFEFILPTKS
jgi:PAS domain S-box-containing protein